MTNIDVMFGLNFVILSCLIILYFVQRKQINDIRDDIIKYRIDNNYQHNHTYIAIAEIGNILESIMDESAKNERRLEKLKEILRRKVATHSNPVEIGIADLTWLIEQAEKAIAKEAAND